MADIQPIKDYIAAVDAHHAGKKPEACQSLAKALGVTKPSPVIQSAIDKMLTPDTMANDITLKLVATEAARRRKYGRGSQTNK